jgi:hypothetical protein
LIGKTPLEARVSFETWRKTRELVKGTSQGGLYGVSDLDSNKNFITPIFREPDTVLSNNYNKVIACHHNAYSQWETNLALQSLDDFANTTPIRF